MDMVPFVEKIDAVPVDALEFHLTCYAFSEKFKQRRSDTIENALSIGIWKGHVEFSINIRLFRCKPHLTDPNFFYQEEFRSLPFSFENADEMGESLLIQLEDYVVAPTRTLSADQSCCFTQKVFDRFMNQLARFRMNKLSGLLEPHPPLNFDCVSNESSLSLKIKECSVCYEFTVSKTVCNHPLCVECFSKINRHMISPENARCPICRYNLILINNEKA